MASEYTEVLLSLITADARDVANLQAAKVDTDGGGDQTFTVGLSPTGAPPITHYWCNWVMRPDEKSAFANFMNALVLSNRAWLYDSETTTPQQVLTLHGLQRMKALP